MFRNVPVYEHRVEDLQLLAARMVAPAKPEIPGGEEDPDENEALPAGYTYLGQFIDHDVTFDPASTLQRQTDPDALQNFRTPRFDLDCLYGNGPADQPYLYRQERELLRHPLYPRVDLRGVLLLEGALVDEPGSPFAGPDLPRNLPRDRADGRALIGDPRNDENLIVSQLHATFLRFHNRVVAYVAESTQLDGDELFKEAQRLVRWHYQWVVVFDFLRRVVGSDVLDDVLASVDYRVGGRVSTRVPVKRAKLLFYKPRLTPFIPVEFSVAAYRFGHSMVRPGYFVNDHVKDTTGGRRVPIFGPDGVETADLRGFRRLPPRWGFQWKYFFELEAGHRPQHAYRIDPRLSHPLGNLPGAGPSPSLAELNLRRGLRLGLPSGTSVARAMGIKPLPRQLLGLDDLPTALAEHPPLWYYVLKEAEVVGGSTVLGPVGGRIVAEVLVGLLENDPTSFLRVEPTWEPVLPTRMGAGRDFDMTDLLRFATSAG
jgi:hypothetical protein